MKTLVVAGFAALIGVGSIAATEISAPPASAAAVVVKVGPGHPHWRNRWFWHGRYWHHRHWACRGWRHRRVCAWRYW